MRLKVTRLFNCRLNIGMIRSILSILLIFLISGCASIPPASERDSYLSKRIIPDNEKTVIYFYHSLILNWMTYNVSLDGFSGKADWATYMVWETKPGEHTLQIQNPLNNNLVLLRKTFYSTGGQTLFFVYGSPPSIFNLGGLIGGVRLFQVSTEEGTSKIIGKTLSKWYKNTDIPTAGSQAHEDTAATKEVDKADNVEPTNQSITISITSPEIDRGLKIIEKSANLTVAGNAKGGSGVAEVLVNGQQAALDDQGHFSSEVLLKPGENQITVSATDTQRKSQSRTFSITRGTVKVVKKPDREIKNTEATVTINTGKYHALIIAVQNYSSREINDLDHPIADAMAIKNILTKRYTFDDRNIIFLKNPDRKTIGTTFNDLRKKLSENDNLLIFYAGHGVWMDDMKEGYWLPRDASGINNPTDWIPNSTIRNYIRALKAKHVLLVADACFSGGIFKVREAFISPNASIEKIYEMQSRKAITSGSLKTVPDRSVFVEYLTKRLRENKENYLDAQKLFVSFKEAVINNSPNNQIPLYGAISEAGDEGGDFVFVRRQQEK